MVSRALLIAALPTVLFPSAAAFAPFGICAAGAPGELARCLGSGGAPSHYGVSTTCGHAKLSSLQVSMVAAGTKKGPLSKALNKASGALTVSIGVKAGAEINDMTSLALRKGGIAAIFADDGAIAGIAKEQLKAKGNFPGPLPVVLQSPSVSEATLDAAKSAGAVAAVLPKGDGAAALAEACSKLGLEAIWAVDSSEAFESATAAGAGVFLVSGMDEGFWGSVPKGTTAIAALPSMLDANDEIGQGQALNAAGCKAILFQDACVGDDEDAEYSKWASGEVRSKASKEFKITGMTGHVNGHYGTGTFEKVAGERVWSRNSK